MPGYLNFVLFALSGISVVYGTQFFRMWLFEDHYPPTNVVPLEEPRVRSVVECARECSNYNGVCQSFFYQNPPLALPTCQLHDLVWNSTITLDYIPNTLYYRDSDLPFYPFSCPQSHEVYTMVTLADGSLFTYRFDNTSVIHDQAFTVCANEGARLAQVVTQAKLDMLYQIRNDCLGYSSVWIDGNNLAATNYSDLSQWETSNGIPIPETFWYPGQPNAVATDHCIYLYVLYQNSSVFADAACTLTMWSLCEK